MTLSGILLGFVLAGSISVERAFCTLGLGYAMYTAASEREIKGYNPCDYFGLYDVSREDFFGLDKA